MSVLYSQLVVTMVAFKPAGLKASCDLINETFEATDMKYTKWMCIDLIIHFVSFYLIKLCP